MLTIIVLTFLEYQKVKTKIEKDQGTYKAKPGLLLENVMAGIEFDESSM